MYQNCSIEINNNSISPFKSLQIHFLTIFLNYFQHLLYPYSLKFVYCHHLDDQILQPLRDLDVRREHQRFFHPGCQHHYILCSFPGVQVEQHFVKDHA